MEDLVNYPSHYTSGKIEVIEALEDWGLGFHRAVAIQYMVRAGKKTSLAVEDLKKARWYLDREIAILIQKEYE